MRTLNIRKSLKTGTPVGSFKREKYMTDKNGKSLIPMLQDQLTKVIDGTETGGKLPSEPALAKKFGVSRSTLREAMRIFETQGMIRRKQGAGTFVIRPSHVIETGLELLESIQSLADRIKLPVQMGDYKVDHRISTENESNILKVDKNSNVHEVSWVMKAEDRPVAYLIDVVPEDKITVEELNNNFNGSILDLLAKFGEVSLASSRTEISAIAAPPDVARALGIQRGDVLLYFVALLFTKDGEIVDYSTSYFLPGYFKFHVVRRVN
jgi:GntR family transcriptional regulator